jgi:hypothetical protein
LATTQSHWTASGRPAKVVSKIRNNTIYAFIFNLLGNHA